MTRLVWDAVGQHLYETGTRMGVLYPQDSTGAYPTGVAWNGLRSIEETPSGADETKLYADDIKYLGMRAAEEFGGTIGAYTYPDEWAECDGSAIVGTGVTVGQQPRKAFGLCYRTVIGNDTELEAHGYKLHLVYNATASPSSRSYETINDSPSAIEFSWEFSTTPINMPGGYRPTSLIVIDSTKVDDDRLLALESIIYGSDTVVYVETSDETPQQGKSYYTRASDGNGGYTYSAFTGVTFSNGTTYYEAVTAGPRLPLPAEVFSTLGLTIAE